MIAALALFSPLGGIPGTTNRAGYETLAQELPRRRRLDEPNPFTCSDGHVSHTESWKVHGTNLGGWLVLEPWITPSLFYQFLSTDNKYGKDAPAHTGMDTYTFCQALGAAEGNKQLRRHWAAWLRDEDIATIAKTGATHVRIPVGDWMYVPYAPYTGCTDGALDELDRVLKLCDKYGLKALLDIHAVRKSQNGFDNSGQSRKVQWTAISNPGDPNGFTTFEHWPIRAADWVRTARPPPRRRPAAAALSAPHHAHR